MARAVSLKEDMMRADGHYRSVLLLLLVYIQPINRFYILTAITAGENEKFAIDTRRPAHTAIETF